MGRFRRLGVTLLALAGLYAVGRILGLDQYLHAARLRGVVAGAGSLGHVLFLVIFVGAVVAQIPGIPFALLAPALFSWPEAWLLCTLGSNVAVNLNFVLVRRMGGKPLAELQQPTLRRILSSLDARPVRAVALLRTLTIMFPPVTSALALTGVSARDHALGSALGLLLPVTALLVAGTLLAR